MKILTENATYDELTEEIYREIYCELRRFDLPPKERVSLDNVRKMINSQVPKMTWNRYEKGEGKLSRTMKNELRVAVKKPLLPPTLIEIVESLDPDMRVTQLGDKEPTELFLVDEPGAFFSPPKPKNPTRKRPLRTTVYPEQNARRLALKKSWQEVINAGLDALSQ